MNALHLLRERSQQLIGVDPLRLPVGDDNTIPAPQNNLVRLLEGFGSIKSSVAPGAADNAGRVLATDIDRQRTDAQTLVFKGMPDDRTTVVSKGVGSTDVDAFVGKLHKAVRDTMEAEALASSSSFLQRHSIEAQEKDWEVRKDRILSALGLSIPKTLPTRKPEGMQLEPPAGAFGTTAQLVDFVNFPFAASTGDALQAPSTTTDLQFGRGLGDDVQVELDPYAAHLAQIVSALAACSQDTPASRAEPLALIHALDEAAKTQDARDGTPRSESWSALFEVVREGCAVGTGFQQFGTQYGADAVAALTRSVAVTRSDPASVAAGGDNVLVPYTSAMDDGMQLQWLTGSLAFLGLLKKQELEDEVSASRTSAARAGWTGDATMGRLPTLLEPDRTTPVALVQAHVESEVRQYRAGLGAATHEPSWIRQEVAVGEHVGRLPLYPQVLLLLKIGAWQDAIQLVKECQSQNPSAEGLQHVVAMLTLYQGYFIALDEDTGRGSAPSLASTSAVQSFCSHLSSKDVAAIRYCGSQYDTLASKGDDPWKATTFCLLAGNRGDATRADELNSVDLNSFLWHRLWFAATEPLRRALAAIAMQSFAPYSIVDVANSLLELGAAHFDPEGKFSYQYAQSLLLVGQPEVAIMHLACNGINAAPQRYLHDAVHLALACNYYGVLRTAPDPATADAVKVVPVPLTSNLLVHASVTRSGETFGLICLDLGHLLKMYAGSVLAHCPPVIVDYFACMPDRARRVQLLAEATAQTSAFTLYAGPLNCAADILRPAIESGQLSRHGRLTPVTPIPEVVDIILAAARLCEDQGRSLDALQLYLRLPAPDGGLQQALQIMCNALARTFNEPWRDKLAAGWCGPAKKFWPARRAAAARGSDEAAGPGECQHIHAVLVCGAGGCRRSGHTVWGCAHRQSHSHRGEVAGSAYLL